MSRSVIAVRDLSKVYRIYKHPIHLLRELLLGQTRHEAYHALRGVDFEVRRGEIVGLVGANGAGKSTLLRILSGVLDASGGTVEIDGQLRAILELGTGFQDDYTGRENVYVGGAFLGYTREEIDASLDWILDFSELRRVIDQPFRTYSSGMKARLTFAVTFFKKPEVMIIDEALSVGDSAFNNKCVNRIIELCQGGATALVVSHNMYVLERLCNRVLYLKDGRIFADGPTADVCRLYEADQLAKFAASAAPDAALAGPLGGPLSDAEAAALLDDPENPSPAVLHLGLVRLVRCRPVGADGGGRDRFVVGEPVRVEVTVESRLARAGVDVALQMFHESGAHVLTTTNRYQIDAEGRPCPVRLDLRRGEQTFVVEFPRLFLGCGSYFLTVGVSPDGARHYGDTNLLMLSKRCAAVAFYRPDTQSQKGVTCDPPSSWRLAGPPVAKAAA